MMRLQPIMRWTSALHLGEITEACLWCLWTNRSYETKYIFHKMGKNTGKACGTVGVRLVCVLLLQTAAPTTTRACQLVSALSILQQLLQGRAASPVSSSTTLRLCVCVCVCVITRW